MMLSAVKKTHFKGPRTLVGAAHVLFIVASLAACSETPVAPPEAPAPAGGKADQNAFVAALGDRQDPIGVWLRDTAQIDEKGEFETDYVQIVLGLAEQENCPIDSVKTFLISDKLVTESDNAFPRTVTSVCAQDPSRAADIFLSAPEATEENDIDIRTVEMFSWDAAANVYRFYRVDPLETDKFRVKVNVDPVECMDCHLGSSQMDPTFIHMAPVMNELTLPWQHWKAEPDFESVDFELTDELQGKENYNNSVTPWLGSAPNLESVIRKGFERVNGARLRARREKPANVAKSMALLRPLFCDERINFVTEDGGTLPTAVYLDEGITNMFKTIDGGNWPWDWYNDRRVRIGAEVEAVQMDMITVRGAIDLDYEQRLVAGRGLSAEQVMRVKALDWKNPVFSEFRCRLWREANERVRIQPPVFDENTRNATLVKELYEEVMTLPTSSGARVSISPMEGTAVIAIDIADSTSIAVLTEALELRALEDGSCDPATGTGFCSVDLTTFGDLIDGYIKTSESDFGVRDKLLRMRNERGCAAVSLYPNAPDIADLEGCQNADF